jgi:di/tricarboxylate transporter
MDWQGWFTLAVLLCMIIALVREVMGPDIIVFIALGLLVCTGIITPREAVIGFSNKGMLTVAILFVVAAAIQNTGALYGFFYAFLGKEKQKKLFLKLIAPISLFSAFLNNTPIVVMFAPLVRRWAIEHKLSPSKYLLPLSYAAILGGMCTLIGTSTTLIVNGLMMDHDMQSMSMFEIAKVGLPCALIGLLYLKLVGSRLLPNRRDLIENVVETGRDYLVEMRVQENSPMIGKNIEEVGLRHLKGLYLVKLIRGAETIPAVAPKVRLQGGDKLVFTGKVETIRDMQKFEGLVPITGPDEEKDLTDTDKMAEAVVSPSSPLIGTNIRDSNFRTRYRASILAVHRNGERINSKIGDIILRPGDTLLLLTSDAFERSWKHSQDFYLVSELPDTRTKATKQKPVALTILTIMILAATLGPYLPKIGNTSIDMFVCAIGAAVLMIVTRCISPEEARQSVELNVLVLIACAFGIGAALEKSGAASFIANGIITLFSHYGIVGVLAGMYLVTILFSAIITNNATAVLMFPIAYATATQLSVNPRPFAILVAIAASASFATPIAYQTNMIVYGPGGYRFSDFLKTGIPLNLILWIIAVALIPFFWSF